MLVNSNQPCPQFWTNVFIIFAFFYLFFYSFFCFFELSVLDYVLSYFAQWFLCKVTCGFGLGCVHVILYNPTQTSIKEELQHNPKGGEDWKNKGFFLFFHILFYIESWSLWALFVFVLRCKTYFFYFLYVFCFVLFCFFLFFFVFFVFFGVFWCFLILFLIFVL